MARKYTKKETIIKLDYELSEIESLYQKGIVNWKGITKDTEEYYTEIIAKKLLEDGIENNLGKIKTIIREGNYLQTDRGGEINESSNRLEENKAKEMKREGIQIKGLGKIIDYQIPLKNKLYNNAGKIDLLFFDENTSDLNLTELKYEGNLDTLLRTILEIYTYYKIIDKDKLIKEFEKYKKIKVKQIKSNILLWENSLAYNELLEINENKRKNLKQLIEKLKICFIIAKINKTTYESHEL